jgi:hypothetical protein
LIGILLLHSSCSTKIISNNFYQQNKGTLDSIESRYEKLNAIRPFAVAFTNKPMDIVLIELISDSLTRIYEFNINEQRLIDSLSKYQYDTIRIPSLIKRMQETKVTWINNYDYWVNDQPQRMIYLSIKPVTIRYPFTPPKYITLAYFRTPQAFDEKGRLLDSRRTRRIRKLNNQTFYKITDRICYTIAEKYR